MRKNLLLSAASLLVCLLLAELGARLSRSTLVYRAFARPSTVPGVGYQFIPSETVIRPNGARYRINEWGFKGPDFPREKPPGTFRIAALGDSVTFAEDQPETYFTALLERRLNLIAPTKGRTYHVVNTAVPSYGTCQQLALLKGYLKDFGPDLVLVNYVYNDTEGVRAPFGAKPETGEVSLRARAFHWLKRRSYLVRFLVHQVSGPVTRFGYKKTYGPVKQAEEGSLAYFALLYDRKGEYWKRTEACFDGFKAFEKDTGVPVVFALVPYFAYLDDPRVEPFFDQVRAALKKRGLTTFDLAEDFRPRRADLAVLASDGVHFTAEGHVLAAELLHKRLRRLLPVTKAR